ncbi:amidohydrolase family protein [Streptomyces sp. NPDC005574]|uniref:amidohydrolase family protein n=1 Tax=Streptomyces sp. NPDC005574 TaxID=3156891 RepID=UPI0033A5D78A
MSDNQPQPPRWSPDPSSPASGPRTPRVTGSSGSSGSWGSRGSADRADGVALLLCGARLTDGRRVDVRLGGGRIEAVGTAGSLAAGGAPGRGTRVDLTGYLLLPAPAEPHAHSDTALSAGDEGPLSYDAEDVQRRATEAALLQLGHGATALRAHVRVGDVQGLDALAAVLRAGRSLRGLIELTAVAMPRVLTGVAGADGLAMLREAVEMGAAVVGGCPDADPDPTGYVEAVLEVASEHGCPVDLHTDGTDPARLARIAAMAGGLRPGVTLGPCGGLGRVPAEVAARTADQLAAAGVAVVCLPQGGCGAVDRRGTAPVRLLRTAGVRVAAGSGALRDASNPVGRGDPFEAAYLLSSRHGVRPEDAYDTVSSTARTVLGLPEVRVEAGFPAELLAVRGDGLAGALSLAYSRIVVHQGRVVARTSAVREYCGSATSAESGLPRQGRGEVS